MLVWIIISAIIGGIVALITGLSFLFWVVSIAIFIMGLPGILFVYLFESKDYYDGWGWGWGRKHNPKLLRQRHEDLIREENEEIEALVKQYMANTKYQKSRRNSRLQPQPESISAPPLRDEKGRFIKKK